EVRERLQISEEELREDVSVLNVVNFGGGSYVLYAEINEETAEIEVDPEPYSDNFDRPARLLPVEAKALIAAIDLIGEHIPEGSLSSVRSEEHTSELQSRSELVCRLLLEKKKIARLAMTARQPASRRGARPRIRLFPRATP